MEAPAPLANAALPRTLRERMLDEQRMLATFRRHLPALAGLPVRVSSCRVRPSSRRNGRNRVVYKVTVEASRGVCWEHTIVGTAPVPPDFLGPELLHLCREAERQPAAQPFTRLAAYVDDLAMALLILPVDPGLPGLAEITRRERGVLLARHIPECREGAIVRRADWTLRRYVPARRCELAMQVMLEAGGRVTERVVGVHVYADDRGRQHHENLATLGPVARRTEHLRIPESLGYDPDHRLLFTAGESRRRTGLWIRRLERNRSLPAGVDRLRVQECVTAAAAALVELQRTGLSPSEEYTYRGELAPLHRGLDLMRSLPAEAAADFERLLESLGAQPIDEETLVPAHGRFGPERLAGDGRHLVILDWDRLCLASPALDAASFLSKLRAGGLRPADAGRQSEHLARIFRREFLARSPDVTEPGLAAYESLLLARHAIHAARLAGRRNGAATRRVHRLIHAAMERLDGGGTRAIAG